MSLENQIKAGEAEGAQRDWNIVDRIIDDDVSGALDPFERPNLGPLLHGEKGTFDAIVFAKIDRTTRDTLDGLMLLRWAKERGKRLIILSPYMDSSTMDAGQRMQFVLGLEMGYYERAQIIARAKVGRESGRQMGKYMGGRIPVWCTAAPHPSKDGGLVLVLDEEKAALIRKIIDRIMAIREDGTREPYLSIVNDLNARGVPPPDVLRNTTRPNRERRLLKNAGGGVKRWTIPGLKAIARNRLLIGQREVKKYESPKGKSGPRGKVVAQYVVRNKETNEPVQFCPPLLSYGAWQQLQEIINSPRNNLPQTNRVDLCSVVVCMKCKSPMYVTGQVRKGDGIYSYYACSRRRRFKQCDSRNSRVAPVYDAIESSLLPKLAGLEIFDRIDPPVAQYTGRLAELRDEIEALQRIYLVTKSDTGRAKLEGQIAKLDEEVAELERFEADPPKPEYRPTGKLFAQLWREADWRTRGDLLRRVGIAVEISSEGGVFVAEVKLPEDIAERLRQITAGIPVPAIEASSTVQLELDAAIRHAVIHGDSTTDEPTAKV